MLFLKMRLYGVVHGGYTRDFLGRMTKLHLIPTTSLFDELDQLPKGKRIGIENLSQEEFDEINSFSEREGIEQDFYGDFNILTDEYWDDLERICKNIGHEVILIDSKQLWLEHCKATIKFGKEREKYDDLCQEEGESEKDYHKKRVRLNEEIYNLERIAEKIKCIDREDALLQRILKDGLDVVVAGIGHTDYWVSKKDEFGLDIESYSIEDSTFEGTRIHNHFVKDATPLPERVFFREGMERFFRLVKTGRLTQATPDYVGIWDCTHPSKGYFEVFVESSSNGNITGKIVDCLGDATFSGRITSDGIKFVKNYTVHDGNIFHGDINYRGERIAGEEFFGSFGDKFKMPFFMVKSSGIKPLDLAMMMFDSVADKGSGQTRMF